MTMQTTNKRLGQVDFADWYDSPMFEIDADERMEERATSAKGPVRLAASALLRLDARAARLRRSSPDSDFEDIPEAPPAPAASQPRTSARTARSRTRQSPPRPAPAASPAAEPAALSPRASSPPVEPASSPPVEPAASSPPVEPASSPPVEPAFSSRRRPKKGAVNEVAWQSWSSGVEDNGLDHALEELHQDHRPAGRGLSRMRRQLAGALDRWAEREADLGLRLDRALFPWTREP